MPGIVSGKFRSMLIDIFGRSYPEKQFFMVDRDAVRRYKARVHRNVARVGERIDAILRNVAVAAAHDPEKCGTGFRIRSCASKRC